MNSGDAVTWKGQRTFVRSLETIIRADRTPLECAVLECNRFAAVAELVPGHDVEGRREKASVGRQSHDETHNKPTIEIRRSGIEEAVSRFNHNQGIDIPRSPKGRPHEKSEAAATPAKAAKESRGDLVADSSSIPVPSPCNVLAVDFLNVLVRAYHAGKPTETHAVRSLFQTVANAIRKIKPAHVVFAMDGGHDLRSQLLPEYKAHRPESEPLLKAQKELAEQALRIAGFQCIRVQGWEADDVLASLGMAFSDTVIVSSDKDLLVMPALADRCRVYHPWGEGSFATAEEKLEIPAHLVTDYLALCGDTSDGIPGVKGIGPKTAATLLLEFDSLENILAAATLGQINAKTLCTKLKEQREAALLCRRVVELNSRLPLPELCNWKPSAGWQQRLTDMRLGAVAAIVDAIKDQRFACSDWYETAKHDAAEDRRHSETNQIANQNSLVFEMDIECLMVLADQVSWSTSEAAAVTCWHAGRKSTITENPWKVGTFNHVAWAQGRAGRPLAVNLSDEIRASTSSKPVPASKSKAGSLFE